MDKQAKAFADLMKQAFPSPLEQAFKDWKATTKKIKDEQIKHNKCGQAVKSKSSQDKQLWNKRRRELHSWKVRAEAVGIPVLPAHRPDRGVRQEWEYKVVKAEMETIL